MTPAQNQHHITRNSRFQSRSNCRFPIHNPLHRQTRRKPRTDRFDDRCRGFTARIIRSHKDLVRTGIYEDDRFTPRASSELAVHRAIYTGTPAQAIVHVAEQLPVLVAGALGVTALLLLYPRMPTVRIVGSDIAHAVPLTLIAGVGHWFLGTIDWALLGSLLIGSLPGIFVGSNISVRVPETVLRLTLAGAIYITAVCLLPEFLILWKNVPFQFGGTSLLIIVVVTMDFMSQVQAYIMSHQYESLLKKANFKTGLPMR